LVILALVSNTSATGIANIQKQFNRISCPLPVGSGIWNDTTTNPASFKFDNFAYNKRSVSNNTLTFTCSEVRTQHGVDYNYGQPAVAIGIFFYVNDYIGELLFNKGGAVATIIGFILTPANFNILGFTLANISGVALMFVIGLYALCYICIGAMVYKILSPFAGVG